jgi:heterotetrameric sarcosine oxidase gamma subunit
VSAPEPRSVLTGHLAPGRIGRAGETGVTLCELACDAVEIAARRGQAEAVRGRLPASTPEIAPGLFFVTTPRRAPGTLAADLDRDFAGIASAVDVSSGLVALSVAGRDARQALAKLCRLDLHPKVFAPGQAARTVMAQIPTLLIQVDDAPRFDLFVPTTLALSFVEHLLHAAAEFGCAIQPCEERQRL